MCCFAIGRLQVTGCFLFLFFLFGSAKDWCHGSASCKATQGWRHFKACNGRILRNIHFWRYEHEALALPALAALGARARHVLVIGGADGGVASQFLRSTHVDRVVLATAVPSITQNAMDCIPSVHKGLQDQRLVIHELTQDLDDWLSSVTILDLLGLQLELLEQSGSESLRNALQGFDVVVFDSMSLNLEEQPSPMKIDGQRFDHFSQANVEALAQLVAPHGLLVVSVGLLVLPGTLQVAYNTLSRSFENVWTLQYAAPDDNLAASTHKIGFMAGRSGTDVTRMDHTWWEAQGIHTVTYNKHLHLALLTPSATLSRVLGLHMPAYPDVAAANRRDPFVKQAAITHSGCFGPGDLEERTLLLSEHTGFQELLVHRKLQGEPGECTLMFLDQELQLSSVYGDFYHEALVHPAMAALGQRGRRVLVIGAGDGGVPSALLRYPGVEQVVQVEIDERVVKAAKNFLPEMSKGYSDARHRLIIDDAVKWVAKQKEDNEANFDLCIIDSTDEPLNSFFDQPFFRKLKQLLAPHGAVVQNVGSQGDWLDAFREVHGKVFQKAHLLNCNTPEYESPYMLALLTDDLDPHQVDWEWWSLQNISTIYYHPTIHEALLAVPTESLEYYINGQEWQVHDASWPWRGEEKEKEEEEEEEEEKREEEEEEEEGKQ